MSKNPPTIQASLSSKPSLKPKTSAKGFERNLMLDLNSKFDMRSPTANPNAIPEKQFYSPTIPADKGGAVQNQAKSPRAKNNIVTITTDHLESREGAGYDNKVHPQTTKTLRTSYVAPNTEKFKPVPNSNEKMVPTKPRESFVKVGAPKYEAFLSKKLAQNAAGQNNRDNSKTDLTINLKDSKIKIMEEPPKKLSMPVNTILTPNNLHTNPGSNSHRAPSSNAGVTEQMKTSNKAAPQTAHLYRKDSLKSDENEGQPPVGMSASGKQHHPLSALLAELGTVSPKHTQGMSRINMGTLGNNTSGQNLNVGDNLASPKEGPNGPTVQNNDLIKLLNDKNREIYRLTNDKLELKSTLESLNGEISGLKKMKMLLRDKEKIIEDLQGSLCEAAKESDELMRELQKENLIPRDASFNDSQGQIQGKKNNNISIGDIEGVKMLISQLKALTDDTGELATSQKNVDQKRSLVEAMMRKNQQAAKNKRTEAAYESFSLEKRGDKTAQSPDPYATVDIYQRNFSSTLEETLGKKAMESPYYDAIKNTVRRNGKTMSEAKLVDNKKGEVQQSTKVLPSGNAIIKRGDSLLGTPRKLHVSPEKVEKQFRVQPNTTSGAEAEILARKFSHDPKLVSKGSSEFGNKKQSIAEAGSTLAYTTEKEANGEAPLDIGKGLSELKDRIARLLNKQRDDHKMLKETHDMYLKKFQELLKS